MKTLSLKHFAYFNDAKALLRLNRLLDSRKTLMPHQVASATGCDIQDAMAILVLLYAESLATASLLIYDRQDEDDPLVPFLVRSIVEGLPQLPVVCEVCGRVISDSRDLGYDFLFTISEPIQFVR